MCVCFGGNITKMGRKKGGKKRKNNYKPSNNKKKKLTVVDKCKMKNKTIKKYKI